MKKCILCSAATVFIAALVLRIQLVVFLSPSNWSGGWEGHEIQDYDKRCMQENS